MTAPSPRVLVVHNAYLQRGGEDAVVEAEADLLQQHGHEVLLYRRDNADISQASKGALLAEIFWSRRTMRDLDSIVVNFAPSLVHVHNIFPLISPSLYWAASRHRLPVVQTLHNFRLLCPQAMLLREGRVCEDCLGRLPWRGVVRRCYRDSLAQSSALAGMLGMHRALGTWQRKVTRYIALNEFCRAKFIAGGLPENRISVKPNFVDVARDESEIRRGGLFVGRLSPEKGIAVLSDALARVPGLTIKVIGEGPLASSLTEKTGLTLHGAQSQAAVLVAMCRAAYLVMPSIWYENFPRTLVEAFACGLPVIASRLGAMTELIEEGHTGLLFTPGDADDLAAKIAWAEQHPDAMRAMGENARRAYEATYTPEINYRQLMAIYGQATAEVAHG